MHLSQPAVAERVRKLEAAQVITGYRATVNLAALGYGIRAIVRVGRADYARITHLIAQTREIVNAFNVTGGGHDRRQARRNVGKQPSGQVLLVTTAGGACAVRSGQQPTSYTRT